MTSYELVMVSEAVAENDLKELSISKYWELPFLWDVENDTNTKYCQEDARKPINFYLEVAQESEVDVIEIRSLISNIKETLSKPSYRGEIVPISLTHNNLTFVFEEIKAIVKSDEVLLRRAESLLSDYLSDIYPRTSTSPVEPTAGVKNYKGSKLNFKNF